MGKDFLSHLGAPQSSSAQLGTTASLAVLADDADTLSAPDFLVLLGARKEDKRFSLTLLGPRGH